MKRNNNFLLFFALYTFIFSFAVLSKYFLGIDDLIYKSIGDKLTEDQLKEILHLRDLWTWLSYLLFPLLLYIKIVIITIIIDLGLFFYNYNKEIKYKQLFNIVVKAEFIFLLPIIIKFVWFVFFQTDYTLDDIQKFAPLSLYSIFPHNDTNLWLSYPLQMVNAFELLYWIRLSSLISKVAEITKLKAFVIVAYSYGIGLFTFIILVMFFTLKIS